MKGPELLNPPKKFWEVFAPSFNGGKDTFYPETRIIFFKESDADKEISKLHKLIDKAPKDNRVLISKIKGGRQEAGPAQVDIWEVTSEEFDHFSGNFKIASGTQFFLEDQARAEVGRLRKKRRILPETGQWGPISIEKNE